MLPIKHITIVRSGQLDWPVTGDSHCGPASEIRGGLLPLRYTITAVCRNKLDDRGFLFDQASVDGWMRELGRIPTSLSCEELAADIGEEWQYHVRTTVPTCDMTELTITLAPAPFAATVSVHFRKGR